MFETLLAADPSFQPDWNAFLDHWRDEPGPLPLYLALGDLSRHLARQLERGETKAFDAVFDVVERWHLEGDPYVRKAATIGLLENLQNDNFYVTGRPEQFLPWLRPESLRYWRKVEAFWEHGTLITDD